MWQLNRNHCLRALWVQTAHQQQSEENSFIMTHTSSWEWWMLLPVCEASCIYYSVHVESSTSQLHAEICLMCKSCCLNNMFEERQSELQARHQSVYYCTYQRIITTFLELILAKQFSVLVIKYWSKIRKLKACYHFFF